MKYFKGNINKLELMKYVKEHLDNYHVIEEPPEYLEAYKMYTSASYMIRQNKFGKEIEHSTTLHIDHDDNSILVLDGTKPEKQNLLNKFKQAPIYNQTVIDTFKKVYEIANHFKFYDNNNIDEKSKKLEKWLNKVLKGPARIETGLKYGIMGKMTTGRSNAKLSQFCLSQHYYMGNDLTVHTCHLLEFPMKGMFKLTISILHHQDGPLIFLATNENGGEINITEPEKLKEAIEDKFLKKYQAAVKKWLKQDKAKFNEDNLLLLEMINV